MQKELRRSVGKQDIKPAKTFYSNEDVQQLCNCGCSRAYEIITNLNKQLEEQGYVVPKKGMVSVKYFHEKIYI